MGQASPFITFICGFCEHPIKAPAESEGRVGRCPNCRLPVQAPQASSETITFDFASMRNLRPGGLREMFHGVAVSFALHAVLLSLLALILVNSRELGRTLITTLFFDTEGTEIEIPEMPVEIPAVNLAPIEGDASLGMEGIATDTDPTIGGKERPRPGGGGGGTQIQATGSIDPFARFSETARQRLERQPAAKRGDYEIALFWDGKSDLDLHVCYRRDPTSEEITRVINYTNRGKPATGFLDVDQNASQPYVDDPIEHIRWNTKTPPSGLYRIDVSGYAIRDGAEKQSRPVPFTVEVKTPDGVRSYTGAVGLKQMVEIDTLAILFEGQVDDPEPEVISEQIEKKPVIPSKPSGGRTAPSKGKTKRVQPGTGGSRF